MRKEGSKEGWVNGLVGKSVGASDDVFRDIL